MFDFDLTNILHMPWIVFQRGGGGLIPWGIKSRNELCGEVAELLALETLRTQQKSLSILTEV